MTVQMCVQPSHRKRMLEQPSYTVRDHQIGPVERACSWRDLLRFVTAPLPPRMNAQLVVRRPLKRSYNPTASTASRELTGVREEPSTFLEL